MIYFKIYLLSNKQKLSYIGAALLSVIFIAGSPVAICYSIRVLSVHIGDLNA